MRFWRSRAQGTSARNALGKMTWVEVNQEHRILSTRVEAKFSLLPIELQ
jgi:hypothetical protein